MKKFDKMNEYLSSSDKEMVELGVAIMRAQVPKIYWKYVLDAKVAYNYRYSWKEADDGEILIEQRGVSGYSGLSGKSGYSGYIGGIKPYTPPLPIPPKGKTWLQKFIGL